MRTFHVAALALAVLIPSAAEARGRVRLRISLPWSTTTPRPPATARPAAATVVGPSIALPAGTTAAATVGRPESDATGSTARLADAVLEPERKPAPAPRAPCPTERRVGAIQGFCALN